ncbi:hypothetical protein SHIRM173S_01347 [Streptomyces hirsutus]
MRHHRNARSSLPPSSGAAGSALKTASSTLMPASHATISTTTRARTQVEQPGAECEKPAQQEADEGADPGDPQLRAGAGRLGPEPGRSAQEPQHDVVHLDPVAPGHDGVRSSCASREAKKAERCREQAAQLQHQPPRMRLREAALRQAEHDDAEDEQHAPVHADPDSCDPSQNERRPHSALPCSSRHPKNSRPPSATAPSHRRPPYRRPTPAHRFRSLWQCNGSARRKHHHLWEGVPGHGPGPRRLIGIDAWCAHHVVVDSARLGPLAERILLTSSTPSSRRLRAPEGPGDMEGTSGCDRLRPVAVPPGMPSTGTPDRSVPGL